MFGHAVISGFAFFALFEMIRLSGPTFASQLNYTTLTGVLAGILFSGEAPCLVGMGRHRLRARRCGAGEQATCEAWVTRLPSI